MNQKPAITQEIRSRRIYFDGGFGTCLQKAGLPAGVPPEQWNLQNPSAITDLHKAYLEAGCDVVTVNSFGISPLKQENWEDLLRAGLACAKAAVADYPHAYLAMDIGPTGKLLAPYGDLPFEDAVDAFGKTVAVAAECGVDLILIETMNDAYETKAAVVAAKENCDLPIFVTNVYDESGKLMTGADPLTMITLLEGLGVAALGMNCSLGPDKMLPLMGIFRENATVPVLVNPNAGLPRLVEGKSVYDMDAEQFSHWAVALAKAGADMLGGCCGTEPDYIRNTVAKTRSIPLRSLPERKLARICSYTHTVTIGREPVLIGERLNPTGKPKLKEALRNGDMEYILAEGLRQAEQDVPVLDLNVGLPELDEAKVLPQCVSALQTVTDLPLQLDTASPPAMAAAMRIYNGKPLVNSVSGKEESLATILPLVKQYGGAVIALTLDEAGIPTTAQERVAIAKRIIDRAVALGIPACDVIVDPLAMTVSADAQNGPVTLETVRLLHSQGIATSLGVSNVSFGLPGREELNAAFLTSALENGLNCAIMNPFSQRMMGAYYAFRALHGMDPNCGDYIRFAAGQQPAESSSAPQEETLAAAIVRGMSQSATRLAQAAVETLPPLEVIQTQLIPALNRVGTAFETGKTFLPQLLMSAEAASAAFTALRPFLPKQATDGRKKVILATVQGDIHDIGKNIVRVLLESYGFDVIDLGKDVPPQTVLEAVQTHGCHLVGLSALMTTTVPAMEATVRLLRQACESVNVVVGGAVLNAECAKQIGADFYAPDAMDTVRYAQQYYGE